MIAEKLSKTVVERIIIMPRAMPTDRTAR